MNKILMAAITGAISAYVQQEEITRAYAAITTPHAKTSPWRLFGHQELVRARANWQIKKSHHTTK